jgi:cation:H+ antiporter
VLTIILTATLALPGIVLRLSGGDLGTVPNTMLFGAAIVAAAFLLTWGAEAAEVDISAALAVAFVALIGVLPEYAVDLTFAWKAGQDPSFAPFAVANMTGSNRLLTGAAMPLVFLLFTVRMRRSALLLERGNAIGVVILGLGALYAFTIPLRGAITLLDTAILGSLFAIYIFAISRAPTHEPELVGPSRVIGGLPRARRRTAILLLFAYAATAIVLVAEPFADGLVHSGVALGIDEFVLVQWVAPFASEAPEFLFAALLAYRGRASTAMGALLSSEVNQWTLLVGGLPVAFALSHGEVAGLPLDGRQVEELLLTAAQAVFAMAVFVSLTLERRGMAVLFTLFALQFLIPVEGVRLTIAGVYVVLAIGWLFRRRREVPLVLRSAWLAFRSPTAEHV